MQKDKEGSDSNGVRQTKILLHIVQNKKLCYTTLPKHCEISFQKNTWKELLLGIFLKFTVNSVLFTS